MPSEAAEPQQKTQNFPAVLKAGADVQISTLHAGVVSEVPVAEGDHVKAGQVLVRITNTEMEIRLQEAEGELRVQTEKTKAAEVAIRLAKAALKEASAEYEQSSTQLKRGLISPNGVAQLKAAEEQAGFNVEKAELDAKASAVELSSLQHRVASAGRLIKELSIKAPVAGVVLELKAKPGELIQANAPACRLIDVGTLIAEAYVPDAIVQIGLMGKVVMIQPRTNQGNTVPAKVTFVSPIVEPVTGTFRIRCEFKNVGKDGKPLAYPGQRASVLMTIKE